MSDLISFTLSSDAKSLEEENIRAIYDKIIIIFKNINAPIIRLRIIHI